MAFTHYICLFTHYILKKRQAFGFFLVTSYCFLVTFAHFLITFVYFIITTAYFPVTLGIFSNLWYYIIIHWWVFILFIDNFPVSSIFYKKLCQNILVLAKFHYLMIIYKMIGYLKIYCWAPPKLKVAEIPALTVDRGYAVEIL